MNTIKVPYEGKGYKISYKVETIDLNLDNIQFMNVYSVFIEDPELQGIVGEHFTILHNMNKSVMPSFDIQRPGDMEEMNLKKRIAQQIMNNPTE